MGLKIDHVEHELCNEIIFEGKAHDLTFEILRNLYGENYSDNS